MKKILILLASVPMLAIPAPAMAQPPVGVCQFRAGFQLVETTGLVNDGIATQAQADRVDRNHDELVCYKVGSSPAILTETLPF